MIQFEAPFFLSFALLLPVLYILRRLGLLSQIAFPLTISDWGGASFEYKNPVATLSSVIAKIFSALSFLFLVVALANPIIRQQEKIFTSRGTDILFVLDTSPSMAAKDISLVNGTATRFEAAKTGIRTLIAKERGASYGIVAMASESACIVPPTTDLEFFLRQLDSLEIGTLGEGTALGTGLTTAIYHLESSKAPKKCIILITDGENNAGSIHPETAATFASERGISLYTFGIGTSGSVPIEYIDKKSGKIRSGFYESSFDTSTLENLAVIAGGRYFGIDTLSSLSASLSEISKQEEVIQTFRYRSSDKNCYPYFLILSLILFAGSWIIRRILLLEVL
ncbi:MAG: VWA domain-containing protein [Treponema sp.]|nr:VWA domain-containing protein [Treponema sp.]